MPVCEPLDIFENILECHLSTVKVHFRNVEIDSRKVGCSDIFFGIKGERFDGNKFAQSAIEKGASLVIMDDKNAFYSLMYPKKILVENTEEALVQMGGYMLEEYSGIKIAVTGSAGKTSTKSMIRKVLEQNFKVYESYKNFNNRLGVAYSAANLDLDAEYAIFELGTNKLGEIYKLAEYVQPHMAVVTNIGRSHIGNFGSVETIAMEKLSLVKQMVISGKTLEEPSVFLHETCKDYIDGLKRFFPNDKHFEPLFFGLQDDNDIKISGVTYNNNLKYNVIYNEKKYDFELRHIYRHFAVNSLAAIAIGIVSGLNESSIRKGLMEFTALEGRGAYLSVGNNLKIIDDTYNASFESVMCAIDDLNSVRQQDKVAVLGEMSEIEGFEGEFYRKLYDKALSYKDVRFLLVGEEYSKFDSAENISIYSSKEMVEDIINSVEDGLILLKAARSKNFDELVEMFREKKKSAV